ncbi:MAG TPA: Fur family transcriptional regulator [Gammaproteobacteria bacterium]|nr:Fur family transcriptional regulator [Gammaproteobacteria bacterium]
MPHAFEFAPLNGGALAAQLASRGVTPTPQRLQIAELLFCKPQHLSADQILAAVNRGDAKVSKATVYNTLRLLSDKGLIREVIVDPTRVFYDPTTDAHHHFYNADTGELTDIPPEQVEFARLPAPPLGTEQDGVEVIVRLRHRHRR